MAWIRPLRIADIRVIPENYTIIVIWEDGRRFIKNMETLVKNLKVFAPLQDKNVFQDATIIDDGRAIAWPGDIDYCADALWYEATVETKSRGEPLPENQRRSTS